MSNLRCEQTILPGVRMLYPDVFADERGNFREVYRRDAYAAAGIRDEFVQDNQSHSIQGVLRGLHYQTRRPQAKLVCVLLGTILDVVVDIRRGSPTLGRYIAVEMSDRNRRQLFVPAGYAHGFCVLSAEADVLYKCSDVYDPGGEGGVLWSDPALAIPWPTPTPRLSPKDRIYPRLADIPPHLLPAWTPADGEVTRITRDH